VFTNPGPGVPTREYTPYVDDMFQTFVPLQKEGKYTVGKRFNFKKCPEKCYSEAVSTLFS
jgi:hypothetical protein